MSLLEDDGDQLGPAPELCDDCEQPHHDKEVWDDRAGWHRCRCADCALGAQEFDYDKEHEPER